MLAQIQSVIAREEAFLPKFAPGTSQHSLLRNRIAALRTVCDLITGENQPDDEALQFALPRIESILHKMSVAREKYEPGSRNDKRFGPTVCLMEDARALIERAIEERSHEPL